MVGVIACLQADEGRCGLPVPRVLLGGSNIIVVACVSKVNVLVIIESLVDHDNLKVEGVALVLHE